MKVVKNIFIVIIIIGLLGVIGYCGYQIYDRLNGNNTEEKKMEEKKDEVQTLDINDELIQELYSYADNFAGFVVDEPYNKATHLKSVGYVYINDKTLVKDIPDEIKLDAILKLFEKKNMSFAGDDSNLSIWQIIPVSIINEYVKKVYGESTTIDYNSIPKYVGPYGGMDEANENYLDEGYRIGDVFGSPHIYTKLIKVEKSNDDIVLYQNICYILGNSDYNIEMYNNFNKEKLLKSWTEEEALKEDPGKNMLDDLSYEFSTYKLTFKKDGNNYYFYSVEKVK